MQACDNKSKFCQDYDQIEVRFWVLRIQLCRDSWGFEFDRNSQTGISVVLRLNAPCSHFVLLPLRNHQTRLLPKHIHLIFDPSNSPHPTTAYSPILNLLRSLRKLRILSANIQSVIPPGKWHPSVPVTFCQAVTSHVEIDFRTLWDFGSRAFIVGVKLVSRCEVTRFAQEDLGSGHGALCIFVFIHLIEERINSKPAC